MNESMAWTVGLGRWLGVRVRVHALLVAFAVSLLWWGMSGELGAKAYGPLCVAVLGVSVLGRELARRWAAKLWVSRRGPDGRADGGADEIVLWPMGGWLSGEPLDSRRGELAVALAPPLASGVLMATGAGVLAVTVSGGAGALVSILPPSPTMLEGSVIGSAELSIAATVATVAALLAWVNGVLLAINLLPVGSLDIAHVFRAVLWNDSDPRRRDRIMARVAIATAVALGVLGWGVWDVHPGASLMLWFVALGMCRRDRAQELAGSRAKRCLAREATLRPERRRCRQSRVYAGECSPLSRVCGSLVADGCFDLPRRQGVERDVPAGHRASEAEALMGQVRGWEWSGIASLERARLFRADIRRRRRRS